MKIDRQILYNMAGPDAFCHKNIDFDMYFLLRSLLSDYHQIMPEDKMEIQYQDLALELNCSVRVAASSLKRLTYYTEIKQTPINENSSYVYIEPLVIDDMWMLKGVVTFKMPNEHFKIYANRCNIVSKVYLILLNEVNSFNKEPFIQIIYSDLARTCSCKVEVVKVALRHLEALGLIGINDKREIRIIDSSLAEE